MSSRRAKLILRAYGYRSLGRAKIALGYALLFLGRALMTLAHGLKGGSEPRPLSRRLLGYLFRCAAVGTLSWFLLGGRLVAQRDGFALWLVYLWVGISIFDMASLAVRWLLSRMAVRPAA